MQIPTEQWVCQRADDDERKTLHLTLKALNSFCKIHGDQRCFFQFEIIINVLVSSF